MELTTIEHNITQKNELAVIHERLRPGFEAFNASSSIITGFERVWIDIRVKLTILYIALQCYRSLGKALKAIRVLIKLKKTVNGRKKIRRCVKVDGKYYFGLYSTGFPSKAFNGFIQTELNRILPHGKKVNRFEILHLAITNKCPLQCEHCFEWHNLNKPETFTIDELKKMIRLFQTEGCAQMHFTGGEPLVRMQRLEALISIAHKESECWVLSSGLNLTRHNAIRLKQAGATGVLISLDHFDAAVHNAFRGSSSSYKNAMLAAKNAREAKLVTAFSVCVTRSFVTEENLMQYARLAKDCGVSFVQLLEPKAVGHYENKEVLLTGEQTDLLEKFYIHINFNQQFEDYPVFIYHGYYQRKIGCLSAGNWGLYVDSAGFINACTFCHTKNYQAHDLITGKLKVEQIQMGGCAVYVK